MWKGGWAKTWSAHIQLEHCSMSTQARRQGGFEGVRSNPPFSLHKDILCVITFESGPLTSMHAIKNHRFPGYRLPIHANLSRTVWYTVLTYTTANVEDGSRLDIAANGFLGGWYKRTFIDVHIFNPHAPSNYNSDLLPETWGVKEEGLWAKSKGSEACLLHPPCPVCIRWHCKGVYQLLQKPRLQACLEVESVLQHDHLLAALSPNLFITTIRHPVYPRFPLKPGPCLQSPATDWSSHFCLPSLTCNFSVIQFQLFYMCNTIYIYTFSDHLYKVVFLLLLKKKG